MNSEGKLDIWVAHLGRITEAVDRQAANGGEECFDVTSGDELGVASTGVLEQGAPQYALIHAKSFSDTREIPHRLDGKLGDVQLTGGVEADLSVRDKSAFPDTVLELGKLHVSSGHCDGGSDFDVFLVHQVLEEPRSQVTKRIHRHNLLGV